MELKNILESNKRIGHFELEIILPSYGNYQEIISNFDHILKLNNFKITILESKLSENIIELCKKYNLSLFQRIYEDTPENYFLFYINNFVQHGSLVLIVYADEYLSIKDLSKVDISEYELIFLNRYEFFYGNNSFLYSKQLRGGIVSRLKDLGESFKYKKSFHDFWLYRNVNNFPELCLNVHHMHNYDVLNDYGKSSKYVFEELKILSSNNNFKILFFKRFILRLISRLLNIRLFFQNKKIYAYLVIAQIIESSNAILFTIENKLKNQSNKFS